MSRFFSFILDINNRLYVHLLFWLAYYLYRVGLYYDIYMYAPIVQFLELGAKVIAVYINLYVLMPFFLKKKKNFTYGFWLLFTLFICGVIQTEVVRQMMRWGIYDQVEYTLYTAHKTFRMIVTIAMVVGYATVIKILKNAYQTQQINQELKQERLTNELKFLKSQINPHFLFNALNNLYSLILMKSTKAEEVVLKLADLLSYMLYETNQAMVALAKDIKYLKGFIELEKLRFGEELTVDFSSQGELQQVYIPPMLLMPLVENAFKHSSGDEDTLVNIRINLHYMHPQLSFEVENTVPPMPHTLDDTLPRRNSGIGLHNVKRRLELLYPQKHTLNIQSLSGSYRVTMILDLT